MRLPQDTKNLLIALSRLRGQPQWRVMVDAVNYYVLKLDEADRTVLSRTLRGTRTARGK